MFRVDGKLLVSDLSESSLVEPILTASSPDVVVNCVALADPLQCEQSVIEAEQLNARLPETLGRLAHERGARLIHLSSDLVFDGYEHAPEGGFSEDDQPHPSSCYAKSKLAGEHAVLAASLGDHLVLRTSLVYGPSGVCRPGPLGWMVRKFTAGERVTLFIDEWRTPVFVVDLALAVRKLSRSPKISGLLHFAGPKRINRVEFGVIVANHLGFDRSLIVVKRLREVNLSPPRPRDVSLNSKRIQSMLGFAPRAAEEAFETFS